MRNFLTYIFFASFFFAVNAQSFTGEQLKQGYALFSDRLTFLYDENSYGTTPDRVYVTGSFRGWDTAFSKEWELTKSGSIWSLTIENEGDVKIPVKSEFKFLIDNAQWQEVAHSPKNEKGGNLVYKYDAFVPSFKAEILDDKAIALLTNFKPSFDSNDYRLTRIDGREIGVEKVLPNTASKALLVPSEPIDIRRVHYLEDLNNKIKTQVLFDGWFRNVYSDKTLGAEIVNGKTEVRLFAPRATSVYLYLYESSTATNASQTVRMKVDDQGIWEALFNKDLSGMYYDFTVHGPSDKGNFFYETTKTHVRDPYARVVDTSWGRARIWPKTVPATPLDGGIPAMKDVIAYEMHVQDFSDQLPIIDSEKGTFKGVIAGGLRNSIGDKIGFDYLVDLGINVVHLMPVQEYLHFPDEDWKASFKDDPYMIDQGVALENYQWGYRTTFAMAVESKYRTKGSEPGAERDEFRDLVQAFHDKGIAVIIDIVPNHTGENMDGGEQYFNFNGIDKQYYYRTKDLEHIGAYGNEVKTENRPMVQRWLIDQCKNYIEEFGIDGFRIDLAGQIDQQTLIALKEAIGEDKIVYGEAWIGSNDPEFENNPDWDWYKEDSPITFFQDDARNAFKGPVFTLVDKHQDRGWPGGKFDERENVMKGLANRFDTDKTPISGINYLDIHDNFALADQFAEADFDGRLAVDQDAYRIAATLLYTSLGPIVTHGGSEIMRSKAHAPLREVVKTTNAGFKVYMHGYRDTYNHRTANQFVWEQVGKRPTATNRNDYAMMQKFWKGLNELRNSSYGEVFRVESASEDYYQFILPENEGQLGYVVDDRVLVLLNPSKIQGYFDTPMLKEGLWQLVGTKQGISLRGMKHARLPQRLYGGQGYSINLNPGDIAIWVRD
jgi:pullulanase